ncbi:MAG: DNA helicase RecG, partial [Thermoguttaceae bacterium]|nr:DNA helicase RecG [Thermoguttaceae bacterium]
AEKEEIMRDFRSGAIQALVATQVVEVGVDVPNATLMTIENADMFGLAQLHQLRGRVGRGRHPAFCVVAPTEYPDEDETANDAEGKSKSEMNAALRRRELARERLEFFTRTTDGFELAEKDFELRGPGELFGSRQHGAAKLRVADLARDREILLQAAADAKKMTQTDPGLAAPEHAALRKQVLARYGAALDLGDVG